MDKPNSRIIEQRLERIIEEQRRTLKGFNRKMEQLQEENHKLREERDEYENELKTLIGWHNREVNRLTGELQSAQQKIERLKEDVDQLHAVNVRVVAEAGKGFEKLIEGLRIMSKSDDEWYVGVVPMRDYANNLLKEIGVTVE